MKHVDYVNVCVGIQKKGWQCRHRLEGGQTVLTGREAMECGKGEGRRGFQRRPWQCNWKKEAILKELFLI